MPDGSNAFMFKTAVRENTPMVMALAGASGSGKTFTALELAMGLADGGKIAVIDTEGRRALHYADLRDKAGAELFRFDHCELRPPFSPERFLEAMKAAERAGYRVIVIDSFSDEHEGEGGLIDMAAAGTNSNSAANWARPKAAHKLIVRWLRQARCHVLFCLRAEERVRLEKDEKGKTVVVPIGWWPVAEKRLMYDMTASFLLSPAQPGIPEPIKLQEQHRRFFPQGQTVSRESGRLLAAWATGGAAVPPAVDPDIAAAEIFEAAHSAATQGTDAFRDWWKSTPADMRDILRAGLPGYQQVADEADKRLASDDDPFGLPPLATDAQPSLPAPESAAPSDGPPAGEQAHTAPGGATNTPAGTPPSNERIDATVGPPDDVSAPGRPQPPPAGGTWQQRFDALDPRQGDLVGDPYWPEYIRDAVALIGEAGAADLAALRLTANPHMQALRKSDGDGYRQITEAIAARSRALAQPVTP